MGRFEAVAARTPSSTPHAASRFVLGALVVASMAAGLSSAGVADATCTTVTGTGADAHCTDSPTSFTVKLGKDSSVSAQGVLAGAAGSGNKSAASTAAAPSPGPGNGDTASAPTNAIAVAQGMLGTDAFGPYGCEDFVDAAYGRTTTNGIGHDQAANFYQSLADRGLGHHEMPIPAGALVFSAGPDGDHVDISRGDGTYISGGVQGLQPGYGDGHNVQILPSPNLGSYSLYGWAYPPW
jgi:hypothetical protein